MTEQAPSSELPVARPLEVLVPLIQEDMRKADEVGRSGVFASHPHYAAAGGLLWEAKVHFANDSRAFNAWAVKSLDHNKGYIRRWMAWAVEEHGGRPFVPNRKPRREPVWGGGNWANIPRMRVRTQDEETESKLLHQSVTRLINTGYKVLATKLHPDKGGSQEAMARLSQARDILKGAMR